MRTSALLWKHGSDGPGSAALAADGCAGTAAVGYSRLPGAGSAARLRPLPGGRADAAADKGRSGRDRLASSDSPQDHQNRILADQALMVAIAGGDETAFARLIGELSPRLLRFARSMLAANPAEAEEVVQEALLRLWRQADTWQPNARVSTWLHQVTYRLCIDSLRRQRRWVAIETVEADLEDEAPVPEEHLIRIDEARVVQEAIDRLVDRQRIAIVLCHFQNLSQVEAAAVMGIGESAYESLLARARRKLRAILAGDGIDRERGGR